jgi:DegV family protein with EDD domain
MQFSIITDSSSNLPEALIDKHQLNILPLEFQIDGEVYHSYLKGAITDLKQFYSMMREGKVITTSLPSLDDVSTMAREVFGSGQDVLFLGFDSALSGTYENVSHYIQKIRDEEFPDRRLECVDSLAAALGQGLFVLEVARQREANSTLADTANWAREHRLEFAHWFTVEDLKYLSRGGRLSKGAAFAGQVLNIKPVLHVDSEGRLVPVDKIRGRKKSLQTLVDKFVASASEPKSEQLIAISHGDCIEDAEFVANQLRDKYGIKDVIINDLDPVIGAHAGPGTVALFFVTDVER